MKGAQLTPRQQYERAYRRFRQYGDDWDFLWMFDSRKPFILAAEYAYEAAHVVPSGWINQRRRTQFLNKKALFMHNREWPF